MNNKIRYKSMIRPSPNAQFARVLRGQRHQYCKYGFVIPRWVGELIMKELENTIIFGVEGRKIERTYEKSI